VQPYNTEKHEEQVFNVESRMYDDLHY